jgi:hypothetical protein
VISKIVIIFLYPLTLLIRGIVYIRAIFLQLNAQFPLSVICLTLGIAIFYWRIEILSFLKIYINTNNPILTSLFYVIVAYLLIFVPTDLIMRTMQDRITYWRYILLLNIFSMGEQLFSLRYYFWREYKNNYFTKRYVVITAYILSLWMLDGSKSTLIYSMLGIFGLLYMFFLVLAFLNWSFSPNANYMHLISYQIDMDKNLLKHSLMEFEIKNNIDVDLRVDLRFEYQWKPEGLLRHYLKEKKERATYLDILFNLRGVYSSTKKLIEEIEKDTFFLKYIKYTLLNLAYLFLLVLLFLQPSVFYLTKNGILVFNTGQQLDWSSVLYFLLGAISTTGYGDLIIKYNHNVLSLIYACAIVSLPLILLSFLMFSMSILVGNNMEFFKKRSIGYLWRDFLKVCDRVLSDQNSEPVQRELLESSACRNEKQYIENIMAKIKEGQLPLKKETHTSA